MANAEDLIKGIANAATAEQAKNNVNNVSGTTIQTTPTTVTPTTPTTALNPNAVTPKTTEAPTIQAPTPVTTTKTATVTPPTTQTSTVTGDQSKTATVVTPTVTPASGTTPVTSTTPESGVSTAMSQELFDSNPLFNDYAKKSGYTVQFIDGNVYVNNSLVDWQRLGMKLTNGILSGTKAQYDQMLTQVKNNGYTTGETFAEFAVNAGYKVSRSSDGKYIIVNGIPVDPELYDGITKLNGSYVGKTETYQDMISEAMMPTKIDPDYVSSTEFADYARKKGYTVKADQNGWGLVVDGYVATTEKYPSLKLANGKVTADEAVYRQILIDSHIYSRTNFDNYCKQKGIQIRRNANGYTEISKDGKNWQHVQHYYYDEYEGGFYHSYNPAIPGWFGSEEIYDRAINDALGRSEYDFEAYCKVLGYNVGLAKNGNITVDGKEIAGTSNHNTFAVENATYYPDLIAMETKWVGSEQTYQKILAELQARSFQTFQDFGTANGTTVTAMNGKVYINGTLMDVSGTSIQVIDGRIYGSEADYQALIDKANQGYTYESPYEAQINAALEEIQAFELYQTPQETLGMINDLMESAQEKFNYDPTQDSALKTAQKEAERIVRETAGTKGLLYSSGTISSAARKAGELIPTYEQQAYGRWADQKTREANLLNTIMEWDNMQAQRNVDKLNLIKTKFDTIMDMDSRTLERFKVLLDQRNTDRQYALELEKTYIEQQQAALDLAWKRVEALGYVDAEASLLLGVPVGTKASWAQQAALEHQYSLSELAQQNNYAVQQQNQQAAIERSLTEYKAALDEASQNRLLAQQYANEKTLAQQQYSNQLYLAKKYGA